MQPDTDADVFLSEINQIRDELSILDETVSTKSLTTLILDVMSAEMYSTVKLKTIQDPDLSLEQIRRMMRTIFVINSKRVSVTKKNPEPKRYQELNRRGRKNCRESAMSTDFISCHYCKKTDHKVRDCKIKLERECEMEKSKISKMESRKNVVAYTIV